MKLEFDKDGERLYETGVSKCVLFVKDKTGYRSGVAWNGITAANEQPEGGEANKIYGDNITYATMYTTESFKGTVEALFTPSEWKECDGRKSLGNIKGLTVGQQRRSTFALCYRTEIGSDDIEPGSSGAPYKLHIWYNCKASPSEHGHATNSESTEADTLSYEINTTPFGEFTVNGEVYKNVANVTIDTRELTESELANLSKVEDYLYGTATTDSKLLLPEEVFAVISTGKLPEAVGE